jgi:superfamily II DNA or RNA helicase
MPAIEVTIDTHIRVNVAQLGTQVRDELMRALTIPNPAKPAALREMLWGAAQMPDEIALYRFEGSVMIIPRGFVHSFIAGMATNGIEISWVDRRVAIERGGLPMTPIALDDYQELACDALLRHYDAMVSAPTGAGKTVIALEAIRRSGQRAIIIVEKTSLAQQWVNAIRKMLGFEAGYIGDRKWDEKDITVALRQSLWVAKDDRQRMARVGTPLSYRSFWGGWGMVLLDEAHHAPADTLVELLQLFPAYIRAGVSATPERDPLTFPIAQAVIGPVVHEATFTEAEDRLVRPRVMVYETSFDFPDYHPTRKEPVWNGKKMVERTVRNNYNEMMAALIKDEARNRLISRLAVAEAKEGHQCLIVSSRKEHLVALRDLIVDHEDGYQILCVMLLGSEPADRAREIADAIDGAAVGSILLSTVADEGLDIPRLDRVFLAYPARKISGTKQKIGRVTRKHPLKDDAVVFDFMDPMKLLREQFRERRQNLYNIEGFEVDMPAKVAA